MKNALDKQYQDLLRCIIEDGVTKQTRNGEVLSVFGYQILHNMQTGFPLLTTKKMAWKQIVTELMWFLRGDTDIRYLWENDCHIWDGDYEKSGRTDFNLGPIYGKQWREWSTIESKFHGIYGIDQIANLLRELETNPDSRRLMVSAWNVGELDQMVLPPCHYGFQVWTRELTREERINWILKNTKVELENAYIVEELVKDSVPKRAISLMWNQRSVDTFLGLPFNIASYGLLLEILASAVDMVPEQLIGNLGDVHLYSNHIEQAKEQIGRTPYDLPQLEYVNPTNMRGLYLDINAFKIKNYTSHPAIKAPLSN